MEDWEIPDWMFNEDPDVMAKFYLDEVNSKIVLLEYIKEVTKIQERFNSDFIGKVIGESHEDVKEVNSEMLLNSLVFMVECHKRKFQMSRE